MTLRVGRFIATLTSVMLTSIPFDYLVLILDWLDGGQICNLWTCGDRFLHFKLAKLTSLRFELEFRTKDAKWPLLLFSHLTGLQELRWTLSYALYYGYDSSFDLEDLPKTLKNLSIWQFELTTRSSSTIASLLPQLECLNAKAFPLLRKTPTGPILPPTIRILQLSSFKGQLCDLLPSLPNLQALHIRQGAIFIGTPLPWPKGITDILLCVETNNTSNLNFPDSLEKLSLRIEFITLPFLRNDNLNLLPLLPRSLTSLELIMKAFPPPEISLFPPRIKVLKIKTHASSVKPSLADYGIELLKMAMPLLESIDIRMDRVPMTETLAEYNARQRHASQ
jgi:hypothetical protein